MIGKRLKAAQADWTTWEACLPDAAGKWTRFPFSEPLLSGGDPIGTAIGKMILLQQLGLPDAFGSLEIAKADGIKPVIFILKCKPSCWRLYFAIFSDERAKRLVYVHAKCKKKNRQDASDSRHARHVLSRIDGTRGRIRRFTFPTG